MPSASRNANKKRKARRNVTLLTRAAQSEAINRAKTMVVLAAVLNKLGGEIEVSKADIDGAAKNLTHLLYVVEPSAMPGFFMIRLVTAPATAQAPVPEQTADVLGGPVEILADESEDALVGEARAIADAPEDGIGG